MDLKIIGATEEITGSRNYLKFQDGTEVLIDFGLKQGNLRNLKQVMDYNARDFEFEVENIDYVIITHAHADHLNALPYLIKMGFKGNVIMTEPTSEFAHITLYDSAKIMESDVEWYKSNFKRELEPLYTKEDVDNTLPFLRCYDFNTVIHLSDKVSVELLVAGHMLGACMPKFTEVDKWGRETSIVFTGDTSSFTYQKPFLPPSDALGSVDYVVTESTYGDRRHEKVDVEEILTKNIKRVCKNGYTLIIPVFAMQRSSEIIWMLREVYLKNPDFYRFPIYLDTPMGVKAQDVMDRNRDFWGKKWIERDDKLGNLFEWEMLHFIEDHQESLALNNNHPKIILSSSGMCNAGRITMHLQNYLPNRGNMFLLTGYQAEDTVGRYLLEHGGNGGVTSVDGNKVDIRAYVDAFSFSSHADYLQLTELLKSTEKGRLKKVFLNHGDEDSKIKFKKHLQRHLRGANIEIAEYNKIYEL